MNTKWIIEVYDGKKWNRYGQPSENFARLYKMCEKFAENNQKARVVKYIG